MKEQLEKIQLDAQSALEAASSPAELEALRIRFLGKKGELTSVLKQMGKLSAEERPVIGQLANQVRAALEAALDQKKVELEAQALDEKLAAETVDVTIPGKPITVGHKHPMSITLDEVKDIFTGMGYSVLDGPEVELDTYNFTLLNTPEGHPARDWQDTFYIKEDDSILLRTQTSPVQIRAMMTQKPPIRVVVPGRVYRKDEADATHSPMFHQMEGLVVDKGITMADLKGALDQMVKLMYGPDAKPVSVRTISRLQSPAARPMCSASSAAARAAASARAKVGLSCWAPAWCIPRCWRTAASTRRSIPASPSASALSA